MIKLRLIQCIWTIWLVLVSAIGFFIVSPIPSKATDLCGQPLALEELLIGSSLQKGYVSTQVKVIEGNVTNSFLIPQEEEEGAPPSKQEKIKEGKWMEIGKEKEGEEVEECKRSVNIRPSIKNVTGTGEGCSRDEALKAARNKAAETNCKNENDPKCTTGGCAKRGGNCKVTAGATAGDKSDCKKITKEGCKQGWTCTVTGTYACDCDCR